MAVGSDGVIRINYYPRQQFLDFHKRKQRWACIVAHRRAGKTVACVHELQKGALSAGAGLNRPRFAYLAPYLKQAKSVAWDYLREACQPLRELGATINESELRVDYHNGGQVRLFGADNADALRGLYLDGVVLDEFSQFDPRVWPEIVRPALSDRRGWGVFIGTPRGHNEFYKIHRMSLGFGQDGQFSQELKDSWYSLVLKASETGLLADDELEDARKAQSAEQYAQEYECSFEAAIIGAYYGKQMAKAEETKRICSVPYDHAAQVWTAWDLGYRDATAVWFAQIIGKEIHLIDYYEAINTEIADDVREIQKKPYNYAGHIVPHDAYATSKQTGKTTAELMEGLGLRNLERAPDHRREDGISNVQIVLPRCWFDREHTTRGVDALKQYHAEWDDKQKIIKPTPSHDWSSHAADSFRYLCMTLDRSTAVRSNFNRRIEMPNLGII